MTYRLKLLSLTLTAALLTGTAIHAESVSMNTDGSLQIEAELKADFAAVGLVYPADQNLTFGQVEELTVVFDNAYKMPNAPTPEEMAATAREATLILSRINTAVPLVSTNPGAMQIGAELKADLATVGLTLPAMEPLTLAQIRELFSLFKAAYKSHDNPTATELADAKTKATIILSRIENPVMAGNDSAAVQVQKDQLKLNMESIGLVYPTNRDLTLDQVVALQAAFDTPDTAAIKGASDPAGERAKVQAAALTALLGQM